MRLDMCLDVCVVQHNSVTRGHGLGRLKTKSATKRTSAQAWSPEEHWRFTQYSGTVSGMPAANWAMRAGPA